MKRLSTKGAFAECDRLPAIDIAPRTFTVRNTWMKEDKAPGSAWTLNVLVAGQGIDHYVGAAESFFDAFGQAFALGAESLGCGFSLGTVCDPSVPTFDHSHRVAVSFSVPVEMSAKGARVVGCPTGVSVN